MLIRSAILKRIKQGEVTFAFRRWRRPTVKAGGSLKTAIGVLAIENVEKIGVRAISAADAHQAGYETRAKLIESLGDREGDLYKIILSYAGDDPRIKLREDDDLTDEQLEDILRRLQRFDTASRRGEWTHRVLSLINDHPKRRAVDLADECGFDKGWFKANVRKLKNLGLTISEDVGYSLSPRGAKVLARME